MGVAAAAAAFGAETSGAGGVEAGFCSAAGFATAAAGSDALASDTGDGSFSPTNAVATAATLGFVALGAEASETGAAAAETGFFSAAGFATGGAEAAAAAEGLVSLFDEEAAAAAAAADFCATSSSIGFGGGDSDGSLALAFRCSSVSLLPPGSWNREALETVKYLVPSAANDTTNCRRGYGEAGGQQKKNNIERPALRTVFFSFVHRMRTDGGGGYLSSLFGAPHA